MKYFTLKTYLILLIYVSTNLVRRLGEVASLVEKKNQLLYQVISRKLRSRVKECCGCAARDADSAILEKLGIQESQYCQGINRHHTPRHYFICIYLMHGGRRASDKYLTESCGILQNLLPGDVVLTINLYYN